MSTLITAIIPAYNEEQTIDRIIDTCQKADGISEVIVVSDGSTDGTAAKAEASGARVIVLPENQGKYYAMRTGVLEAKTELIVFLDADLVGFRPDHLSALIEPVISGRVAMQIGYVDRGLWNFFSRLFCLSGQRALARQQFLKLSMTKNVGYSVETALNALFERQKLIIGKVRLNGLSYRSKIEKIGIRRAVAEYLKMWFVVSRSFLRTRFISKSNKI